MVFLDLVHNVTLLVALVIAVRAVDRVFERDAHVRVIVAGVLFGLSGIVCMLTPMQFAPGVIYDGRSIVLTLSGLFSGPVAGIIAALIAGGYRWFLGGAGVVAGIVTIIEAAAIGIALGRLSKRTDVWMRSYMLWVSGLVVHVLMLAIQVVFLPDGMGWEVVRRVGAPILILFPVGFLVAALAFIESERRRTQERRLVERQEYLDAILKTTTDGFWTLDEHGQLTEANDAFCRMSGYSRRELLSMSINDIDCLESPSDTRERIERIIKNGAETFETMHRRKDGAVLHVEVSSASHHTSHCRFVCFGRDISERKRRDRVLAESEERYRTLVRLAPIGIFTTTAGGGVVSANESMARMLGFETPDQAIDHYTNLGEELYVDPDRRREFVRRLSLYGRVEGFEYLARRVDGEHRWFTMNARISGTDEAGNTVIEGFAADITKRQAAEIELMKFRTAIERASYGALIAELDGRLSFVNEAFAAMHGYRADELVGRSYFIFHSREQMPLVDDLISRLTEEGNVQAETVWHRHADGTDFPTLMNATLMNGINGSPEFFSVTAVDISRQYALEQQSRQSQKMEAIGQLTGGVAHDFNNLLQVINGTVDLLLAEKSVSSQQRDQLTDIAAAGERAARLVGQLLQFSRRQIINPETVDPNDVVTELLSMLRRIIGEQIRIDWSPALGTGGVSVDRGMIEQVLLNLCLNARDAMPNGGVLKIEVHDMFPDPDFCSTHPWAEVGRYVEMSVTDSGIGMDTETLEHAFEPFFTTKHERNGTGLGLATAYGIVKQHGGMLSADSSPGSGSVFRIYLPAVDRPAMPVRSWTATEAVGGDESILLAEDDPGVRAFAERVLTGSGYTCLACDNGAEAVALFQSREGAIDLVLLDVVMPVCGGVAAYEQIRSIDPEVPVVFASGYSESAVHTDFVLNDGFTLLQKPYPPRELLRVVRRALDRDDSSAG